MTPHFSDQELSCRCGCGMTPKRDFIEKIERLRVAYGKPMKVTSAARCPNYNSKVSKTGARGPHTTGRAIDIAVDREDAFDLLMLIGRMNTLGLGITGLGFQQKGSGRFMHLDDLTDEPGQPRPTVWSY